MYDGTRIAKALLANTSISALTIPFLPQSSHMPAQTIKRRTISPLCGTEHVFFHDDARIASLHPGVESRTESHGLQPMKRRVEVRSNSVPKGFPNAYTCQMTPEEKDENEDDAWRADGN